MSKVLTAPVLPERRPLVAPEPATTLIVGTALVGIGLARRKAKTKSKRG